MTGPLSKFCLCSRENSPSTIGCHLPHCHSKIQPESTRVTHPVTRSSLEIRGFSRGAPSDFEPGKQSELPQIHGRLEAPTYTWVIGHTTLWSPEMASRYIKLSSARGLAYVSDRNVRLSRLSRFSLKRFQCSPCRQRHFYGRIKFLQCHQDGAHVLLKTLVG